MVGCLENLLSCNSAPSSWNSSSSTATPENSSPTTSTLIATSSESDVSDAERQWETLKSNIEGYTELKAQKEADAQARWLEEQVKQDCKLIDKLIEIFENTADDDGAMSSSDSSESCCDGHGSTKSKCDFFRKVNLAAS